MHVLAAVIWVGGMFFAYVVLRPATGPLDPHARLELWGRVFRQFFPWVWASVVALLLSGYGMVFLALGGFGAAGVHVHIMQAIGLLMIVLFLHLYFAPWARLRRALEAGDDQTAARQLGQISLDGRDQSGARTAHLGDRRERPLLGLGAAPAGRWRRPLGGHSRSRNMSRSRPRQCRGQIEAANRRCLTGARKAKHERRWGKAACTIS